MAEDDDLELALDVRFELDPPSKKGSKAQPWFKNKANLERIVDALAELPLYQDLKVAGVDDKLKTFKTADALKALVATGRADDTNIQSTGEDDSELRVVFLPSDEGLWFKIWCWGSLLRKHAATIVDQYITATRSAREALGDAAGIFVGFVYPQHRSGAQFQYPRPRPPRSHPVIPMRTVVDLVDVRFHSSKHPDAQPDEAHALTASEPPKPARRIEEHGLVALQWAQNASPSELRRAASQREVWIPEQIPMPVEGGFNEQGDMLQLPGNGAEPKPPLTLYSAKRRTGYKAVVVFPDGAIEPHAWNQAKMVLKNKQLGDGSPVDAVTIVVPLREHVFTISEEAKKEGFAAVVYPSNDGSFWNPNPPGEWLSPPVGAAEAKPLKPRIKKSKSARRS